MLSHCHAEVGCGHCWGVVDTVADKECSLPLDPQGLDHVDVVLGEQPCSYVGDADVGGEPLGCTAIVSSNCQDLWMKIF